MEKMDFGQIGVVEVFGNLKKCHYLMLASLTLILFLTTTFAKKRNIILKNEGFEVLNPEPKKGADNKLICFLHPKTTNGVLIELCQEIC